MKKNKVFWSMIGFSAALHGMVMIGVPSDSFRTQHLTQENQFSQTIKMIKVGTRPPKDAPKRQQEEKVIEKDVKPTPEVPSIADAKEIEETVSYEAVREAYNTEDGESGNDEEEQEGAGREARTAEGPPECRTTTGLEYEALLAYIKDFIEKNLVYPPMARRRNIEGIVGVHFEIERSGGLTAVAVDHSSGSSILDNAAVSLIEKMCPLNHTGIKRKIALRVNIEYKLTK
jgi:TonB family protein